MKKEIELSNDRLEKIKDQALYNVKNISVLPNQDHAAFLAFCWTKAVLDHVESLGSEVTLKIKNKDIILEGIE